MSKSITIEIAETGTYTVTEIKKQAEWYISTLVKTKPASLKKYFGTLKLSKDPLQTQREMRDEW